MTNLIVCLPRLQSSCSSSSPWVRRLPPCPPCEMGPDGWRWRVAGFEERTRRIKIYRKKLAMHKEATRRAEELRKKAELAKQFAGESHADKSSTITPRQPLTSPHALRGTRSGRAVQRPAAGFGAGEAGGRGVQVRPAAPGPRGAQGLRGGADDSRRVQAPALPHLLPRCT
jgi:hypothetical protein